MRIARLAGTLTRMLGEYVGRYGVTKGERGADLIAYTSTI